MIISRTPFRISFFGGGTDYPVWYRQHGGAVLSTTINKYCHITCRYLPPFFDHRFRIVYSKVELTKNRAEIQHPAVREALRFIGINDGLEVHHDGDLPARTGLGSSSSFTVGLLHTLYSLKGVMPSKMQLAQDAIHVEQDLVQENVGSQDQVAAAFGGMNRIEFQSGGDIRVTPIIVDTGLLDVLQNNLMLYFTGFSRYASEIAAEQIRKTPKRKAELRSMLEMVDEAQSILTSKNWRLLDFGKLLDEGWQVKRLLTDYISTPRTNEIYKAARSAGAVGGKLLGAGGGGFMLFFVKPEDKPRVREALNGLLEVPFRFEGYGSHIIFYENNGYFRKG